MTAAGVNPNRPPTGKRWGGLLCELRYNEQSRVKACNAISIFINRLLILFLKLHDDIKRPYSELVWINRRTRAANRQQDS